MNSNLLIATGCYTNVPRVYPGAISISISTPRYYGKPAAMPQLAPRGFKDDPIPQYKPKYASLLARLDAREVLEEALQLAYKQARAQGYSDEDAGKVVPVLLCWERPGEFCHRRLAADWLQAELGLHAPEVKFYAGHLQIVAPRSSLAAKAAAKVDQASLF